MTLVYISKSSFTQKANKSLITIKNRNLRDILILKIPLSEGSQKEIKKILRSDTGSEKVVPTKEIQIYCKLGA